MNNVRKQKRANKSLPFFFKDEFKVSFIIIFISTILLITTFSFDIVPPILNRGIQPATFPKALLVLIISLTFVVYFLSTKKPWKVEKKLPKTFYLTLIGFLLFAKTTETQSVPSFISVNASPKFKTPTSISPLIRLVLIGATPL